MHSNIIIKHPQYENDSTLFTIDLNNVTIEKLDDLVKEDLYYATKRRAFLFKNTDKDQFEPFANRPAFRNFKNTIAFTGSVYTKTCEIRNNDILYEDILQQVSELIKLRSRRAIIRFTNPFDELYISEVDPSLTEDISCISTIHYVLLDDNTLDVKFNFRASDCKNELYYDIITLYEYFVMPIYRCKDLNGYLIKNINPCEFYLSTTQNTKYLMHTIKKLALDFDLGDKK